MRLLIVCGGALWAATNFATGVATCVAQDVASPIYKLPGEGVWAQYSWVSYEGSETRQGQMKITSGRRVSDREGPRRWIEFAMTPSEPNQPALWRLLLVDDTTFERDKGMRNAVREAFGKSTAGGEYAPLSAKDRENFLNMGIEGKLRVLSAKTPLKLSGTTYQTQILETDDSSKKLQYRVWLAPETPFGFARFTITNRDATRPRFEADLMATSRP